MNNNSLYDAIVSNVLKLFDDGVNVDEIVVITKEPRYLIETILVNQRNIYFR